MTSTSAAKAKVARPTTRPVRSISRRRTSASGATTSAHRPGQPPKTMFVPMANGLSPDIEGLALADGVLYASAQNVAAPRYNWVSRYNATTGAFLGKFPDQRRDELRRLRPDRRDRRIRGRTRHDASRTACSLPGRIQRRPGDVGIAELQVRAHSTLSMGESLMPSRIAIAVALTGCSHRAGQDPRHMDAGRLGRDEQRLGDLGVRLARRQMTKDLRSRSVSRPNGPL